MRDAAADVNSLVGAVVEDRYVVESALGEGAMGAVYRARHIKVGRTVAIKVLHDHLVQDETMCARFEREAMMAAKLKHPNLIAVIDLGTTPDGKRCMVLEYAPGRCLADMVSRAMPRARVIDVVRQLLRGLDHAHSLGLVHRDLKPENILVEQHDDGSQTPRIVDFGIATLRNADDTPATDGRRLTTTGLVIGTPMYMAPEQARGETVDHRADLFALGVIVYELLAGKPPFEGSGVEIMMLNMVQDPPSIATRSGLDVDPHLEAFARKLMARERTERFATAQEALETLEEIAAVPEPIRERDAAITRKHIVSLAMMPLAKMAVVVEPVGGAVVPPRRHRWGTIVGAAAIIGLALLIVVLLANAARAHGKTTDDAPIQQTAGCTRKA